MDVSSDNKESPSADTQPSGKMRKGFKLFGKRKPGNIFSLRSKGDGNKSPVMSLGGVSEMPDPEMDKEKEVSQAEEEQPEDDHPEDGVPSAPRHSISSACSAKSLGFLSMLRGGRKGRGDRRSQTVSQPGSRQRRGLKGLFGSVKFHSKDKEEKEEPPPSPLLMSSRANSVEIIKEDLPLTPQSQPRSLNITDSAETRSQAETVIPAAGTVSKSNQHVRPLSPTEAPLVAGETSLSSLLEDISSLLTFDTISGGGDIVADVEAEWGKAMKAITTEAPASPTSTTPKPLMASMQTSTSALTPPVQTPVTRTNSSPAKPSTIITTLTKTFSLTTHSSSYSSPARENVTTVNSMSTNSTTSPVVVKSFNSPKTSSPLLTVKSGSSNMSSATAAPLNTPLTTLPVSLTLTTTASKLASDLSVPAPKMSSVSEASAGSSQNQTVTTAASLTTMSYVSLATASGQPTSSFSKPAQTSLVRESHTSIAASTSSDVTTQPTSSTPLSSLTATTTFKPRPVDSTRPAPMPSLAQTCTLSTTKCTPASSLAKGTTPAPAPSSTPEVETVVKESSKPVVQTPNLAPQSKPSSQMLVPVTETTGQNQVSEAKSSSAHVDCLAKDFPAVVPASLHNRVATIAVQSSKETPLLPVSQPNAPRSPDPVPCETTKTVHGTGQPSLNRPLSSPRSPEARGAQMLPSKTLTVPETQTSVSKERKTPQGKALSKIPVVGGGRSGKLPVRNSQSFEDRAPDLTSPVNEEEMPHVISHVVGAKLKMSNSEANVPNSKQSQDESQQAAKHPTTSPRDSKIPLKQGASQIPQAKDTPRTKIPVSRVPVRRPANKSAAASSNHMRK